MRWNIILFSNESLTSEKIQETHSKLDRFCEIISTYDVEQTIESYLYLQSEIVIVCSDVSDEDLKKLKSVLHHINSDLVIIENFDYLKYNVQSEIRKAIDLYNTSNSDLFKVKFSPN